MNENYRSAQFKRGIVRENDAKTGRSRVEFLDEDETQSYWLGWNMAAAGASKIYNQPDIGSQVNCLIDRHGEDGIVLGARYSEEDKTPTDKGHLLKALLEGGLDFEYDKQKGALTIKLPKNFSIEAESFNVKAKVNVEGETKIKGETKIEGATAIKGDSLKHNDKNIGADHKHKSAPSGPPGEPI